MTFDLETLFPRVTYCPTPSAALARWRELLDLADRLQAEGYLRPEGDVDPKDPWCLSPTMRELFAAEKEIVAFDLSHDGAAEAIVAVVNQAAQEGVPCDEWQVARSRAFAFLDLEATRAQLQRAV